MVFGLGHHHQEEEAAYNTMYGEGGFEDNEPSKMHEMLAGAAAFAAMRQYEHRRQAEGHQDHALAREMLAAITAAEVDKLAETKGMDYVDRERAKERARAKANNMYDTQYGGGFGGAGGAGGEAAGGYGGDEAYAAAGRQGMGAAYQAGYEQRQAGYGEGEAGFGVGDAGLGGGAGAVGYGGGAAGQAYEEPYGEQAGRGGVGGRLSEGYY